MLSKRKGVIMNFVKSQDLEVEIKRYKDSEVRSLKNSEKEMTRCNIDELVKKKLYDENNNLKEEAVKSFINKCLIKPQRLRGKNQINNYKLNNYKLIEARIYWILTGNRNELNKIKNNNFPIFEENAEKLFTPYVMKKSKKVDLKNTFIEIASNKYDKKKVKKILENDIEFSMSNVVNSLITDANQKDQVKRYTSRQYYSEITENLKDNNEIGYWYSKGTYIDQQLKLISIEEISNSCINGNKTKRMVKDIINEHLHTKKFFNYNNLENNELFNAEESEKQRYEAYGIIKELNIYINKAIKVKKKKRRVNINYISTKKFKEYYKHTQRNKLNAYLLSEGKRKIFYLANKIPENEQAKYSISKEGYDLFKMNHIIVNKALDLFTDAEIALKSITDEKFNNYDDIFMKIDPFVTNVVQANRLQLLLKRKINYRFNTKSNENEFEINFKVYLKKLKDLRNLLFHAKTEIGKISAENLIESNGFNILTDFYNDNLADFLVEKYIGTKISICLTDESLGELIDKSANNMIMSSNYKHLSVNKLFENKIIAAMNWDLKKIKDLDELTEIKHAQKNVIRIIYKNIFLEENNLNELLVDMHNKKSRNNLLNKTNDYMSQVQKEISILENENKFKEAKEIKICMYETYTQVFIEFLNENTKLYNYKNHYTKEFNYDDTKEKIESIIKSKNKIEKIEKKYETWLMLLSLATSVQLSEFKGDLIKYSNLIEKQSGNNSLSNIKELIRIISIVLMVKNSKYQMHETTNLKDIYPQEDIKNLYNKILDSNLEEINQQMTESGFENYYLQSDEKTYVYHKSIISILDTLSEFKQYESFFNNALKVKNELIPKEKLTTENHKNLNQAKEKYFNNENAKNTNNLFKIEKEHIKYNQKMRILSLNYHLDILNIQREIQSRLISLMRNREMDMLFITAALTEGNEIELDKKIQFDEVLKGRIDLLEKKIKDEKAKEILFNKSPRNNVRQKIAHFSLFVKKDDESSIYYLNNKTGLIKEVKNLFRYDIKKEKSIETIIESVFEKYGYFVTFDSKTGNLIQKPQLKYIQRGKKTQNRINLTSKIEQENIVKVFSEMKVYIK